MQTLSLQVVGARPGTTVEVVPGAKTYVSMPLDRVDPIAVTEFVPAGGGTFRVVARVCPRWFQVTRHNLRRLGIAISARGMGRLIDSGFIKGMAVTPGVKQFDYQDYIRHEQAVLEDPEFWDRKEQGQLFCNRERYRKAM